MSFETIRINELAKELGLTSKEVIEKFAQLSVTGKTHSSTVTMEQVKRLKEFIASGGVKEHKKPKAFVVKKAKAKEKQVVEEVEVKKEEKKAEPVKKASVPRVEIVKTKQPQSRLEIVRRAPRKPAGEAGTSSDKPERPAKSGERKFPPRGERTTRGERPERGERPYSSRSKDGVKKPFEKPSGERKPIQRTIISQDIYENKGNGRRRTDGKKKGKDFNNKKEEQERISLEKAAAQKHKKRSHKEEETTQVTQVVVNKAMTISELSEKIQHTPAEIIKFLMLNGIMATVNQLIDVDVIKKICAEYELEVLDEDLDAYMEEELEKEEKEKKLTEVDKKLFLLILRGTKRLQK